MQGLVEIGWTLVFQLINTVIIYLALRHFLFKPTTEFMDGRRKKVEDMFQEAELRNKEADDLKAQYDEKLEEIKRERAQLMSEASKRAEQRGEEILKAAREEAQRMVEKARLEIERERQKTINELKGQISEIAIAAASKVIEKDLDPKAHQNMIQQFIDEVGETQWQN